MKTCIIFGVSKDQVDYELFITSKKYCQWGIVMTLRAFLYISYWNPTFILRLQTPAPDKPFVRKGNQCSSSTDKADNLPRFHLLHNIYVVACHVLYKWIKPHTSSFNFSVSSVILSTYPPQTLWQTTLDLYPPCLLPSVEPRFNSNNLL